MEGNRGRGGRGRDCRGLLGGRHGRGIFYILDNINSQNIELYAADGKRVFAGGQNRPQTMRPSV